MIGENRPREDFGSSCRGKVLQPINEILAIKIVPEDGLALQAACDHVV
jgi:phage baseplate assembly protein W